MAKYEIYPDAPERTKRPARYIKAKVPSRGVFGQHKIEAEVSLEFFGDSGPTHEPPRRRKKAGKKTKRGASKKKPCKKQTKKRAPARKKPRQRKGRRAGKKR